MHIGAHIFNMIGLSTSLLCSLPGDEIVARAADMGFSQIELNFTLRPEQVRDIEGASIRHGIHITSLHNFVPEPSEGERAFMLSDIDESLRTKAIDLTRDTIRRAADLGARAVILHMGQPRDADFDPIQDRFRKAIHSEIVTEDMESLRNDLKKARKKLPGAYLDSMLLSLDKLAPFADDRNIRLGVENRYFYGQFPNFEELGIIMQEFSGSGLGYWHDCGHAAHLAYCGLGTETENLDAIKGRLIGVHLHDIKLWYDHQVTSPEGNIDFAYLTPYIDQDTLLVMELSGNCDHNLVGPAIEYLAAAGGS